MMRSPFSDFVALRDTLDRVANHAFGDPMHTLWSRSANGSSLAQPMPLDVYATEEQAVISAAVPGMRPEDLEVTVHQNTISLSGTIGSVAETQEAKGATWYIHEVENGTYQRSVTLPFPLDPDRVEASFEHGIVRIVAPKAAHAKPHKIAISGRQTQPEAITANGETPDETPAAVASSNTATQAGN
jgi:HSP20 family protein